MVCDTGSIFPSITSKSSSRGRSGLMSSSGADTRVLSSCLKTEHFGINLSSSFNTTSQITGPDLPITSESVLGISTKSDILQ